MVKIPYIGVVKNVLLFPVGVVISLFVLGFFYYFFLFFAYDLNPDFIQMNQCDRYKGEWDSKTRSCDLRIR